MITFNNVSKTFADNGVTALRDVNLTIENGEFVFIVGKNGAGKSTFAKLLIREEKPTGGEIIIDDFNLGKISENKVARLRRRMGIIFQEFRLFNDKTVYENVAFVMRIIGEPDEIIKRRVPWLLDLVGMTDKADQYPNQLSGGQQQRVAFVRAIANNPDIIIADEPTGNIDPEMRTEIMGLLKRLNEHGKTVIVITHEKAFVDYYKQRVITIDDGTVISDRKGGYDDEETL